VTAAPQGPSDADRARDIAEVPAAEVIASAAVHLMSAAAVKCGLADGMGDDVGPADARGAGGSYTDLDEARKLITALAGLVQAARPDLGVHAAPLRDGLQALQKAFREASPVPDEPGEGPGEKLTGPV
jgi:hypothetical protein